MNEIVLVTKGDLRKEIRSVLIEHENEIKARISPKLYSKNQVAKKLGLAHATVSKYVKSGVIKSTKSGLITEEAINDFLNR